MSKNNFNANETEVDISNFLEILKGDGKHYHNHFI